MDTWVVRMSGLRTPCVTGVIGTGESRCVVCGAQHREWRLSTKCDEIAKRLFAAERARCVRSVRLLARHSHGLGIPMTPRQCYHAAADYLESRGSGDMLAALVGES